MNKEKENFIAIARSTYTMQNASGIVVNILKQCKEKNITSLAITDHGNMNSYGDLYLQAEKYGIKPVFGCEFACVDSLPEMWRLKDELDKDNNMSSSSKNQKRKVLKKSYNLTLLAKNATGLKNLFTLVYLSYKDGFYFKPRIDMDLLKKYSDGIICVSSSLFGDVQQYIINSEYKLAIEKTKSYQAIFGEDFYFGLQFNDIKEQNTINKGILKISEKMNISTILTNDSFFINKGDEKARQSLLLLQFKKTHKELEQNPDFFKFNSPELYLKNKEDMQEAYKLFASEYMTSDMFDKALQNTLQMDNKIQQFKVDTTPKLPNIIENPFHNLVELCKKGLQNKGLTKNIEYINRLKFELDIIRQKKFSQYFLVCYNIVSKAKEAMLVGPARGSAAGSLITYLLGITDVDPIKFGLYFERFLNIDRDDFPDIDIDFEDPNLIKDWIKKEFGESNVASITAYGTFKMKNLLKDLGRVHDIPLEEVNLLNKTIDKYIDIIYPGENKSIVQLEYKDFYEKCPEFKNFMDKYPQITPDYHVLINQIRQIGKHAAGVIISDNLYENMPTVFVKGELQTGITEGLINKNLSELGFIKFDILGLSTLKIIHDTAKLVAEKTGINKNLLLHDWSPDKLDLNLPEIYKNIFMKGRTAGIFQFGGDGMKKLLKQSNVDCFEDLVAVTSLYRPGPLASGLADSYGERKKNPENIVYKHPIIKRILQPTYNLMIFQEQLMALGNQLGGLTLAETNTLRKVIVKQSTTLDEKKNRQREKLKQKFIQGSLKNGLSQEDTDALWNSMEAYASYGFNRSHAAAYSIISYQTAYLKQYHTLEFYTALLNDSIDNEDNLKIYINEAIQSGIKFLPPNINKSKKYFSVEGDAIKFGLLCVKGVGEKACDSIMSVTATKQFLSLRDFFESKDIKWRSVNQKVVRNLINFGYFDIFDKNRKRILEAYKQSKDKNVKILSMDGSKFLALYDNLKYMISYTDIEIANIERQLLGFNFFYDPFKINKRELKTQILKKVKLQGGVKQAGGKKRLLGMIVDKREHLDKNDNLMAFLRIQDEKGEQVDMTIFSSAYEYLKNYLELNKIYLFKVKESFYQNRRSYVLNTDYEVDARHAKHCALDIDDPKIVEWLKRNKYDKFN